MKELRGKVAVVTGAASGIGRALARRGAREGMRLALADVEEAALVETEKELSAEGAEVLAIPTDVSRLEDLERLADRVYDRFGGVHLLCNNAGVSSVASVLDSSWADWQWVLGVNLWGVLHGIKVFVPRMLESGEPGHVVNTASEAGLVSGPGFAIYKVAKHGVLSLSETLHHDLRAMGSPIHVSVFCPGTIRTRIADAERNRPAALRDRPQAHHEAILAAVRGAVEEGPPAEIAADAVFEAVDQDRFYVFVGDLWRHWVETRSVDMIEQRNPVFSMPDGT